MDLNKIEYYSADKYFNGDILTYSPDKSVNDSTCILSNLLRNDEYNSDPFDIMKHDPAILEAFLIVDKKKKEEDAFPDTVADVKVTTKDRHDGYFVNGSSFEEMEANIESSLLSLSQDQLALFLSYARVLRSQRELNQRQMVCAFCKKNGKLPYWYNGHVLRDNRGRVRCPVLRNLRCPRCSATGDNAHTLKYCPQ